MEAVDAPDPNPDPDPKTKVTSQKYSTGMPVTKEMDCFMAAFRASTSSLVQPSRESPLRTTSMASRRWPGAAEGDAEGGEGACELSKTR